MRVLKSLPNREVEALRQQMARLISSEITEDTPVVCSGGKYAKLHGVVIEVEGDVARVLFQLRSWERIATIPTCLLEIQR